MQLTFLEIIKSIFKVGLGYKVLIWTDEAYPDYTNYQMRGNFIKVLSGEIGSGGNIDFSADAIISNNKNNALYSIILKCNVADGLYIQLDNSLSIILDGKMFDFNLEPSLSKVEEFINMGEKYLIEVHRFMVNRDFIKLIANSTTVEIIIRGKEQEIQGCLSQKNIRRFSEFYHNYLDKLATD